MRWLTCCLLILTVAVPGGASVRDPPSPAQAHLIRYPARHPPLCHRYPYHTAPARGRALSALQATVRDLARRLAPIERPIEEGAIIYLRPDGSLRVGAIAAGDFGRVDLTAEPLEGEVIIAAAHTHPRDGYRSADQRLLSASDIALGRRLLAHPRASPRLLLYVIDIDSATISEYPASPPCPR